MSDETRKKAVGADAAGDCGHLHVHDFYDHAERVCGAAWVVRRGDGEVWRAGGVYAAGGGDLWAAAAEEVGMGDCDGGVFAVERRGLLLLREVAGGVFSGAGDVRSGFFSVPGAGRGARPVVVTLLGFLRVGMVFWWTGCGVLCGRDGQQTVTCPDAAGA